MTQQENLFKSIGQLAQDTDARPEVDDDDVRLEEGGEFQEGGEREVEQVESLCMECHEQVRVEIRGRRGGPSYRFPGLDTLDLHDLFEMTNPIEADLPRLCAQGVTRMLLTSIPYFREVIIMSFRCEHCGNSNTEIQSAGEIQREFESERRPCATTKAPTRTLAKGCIYSVHILNAKDLNRQLVKSNTCTITIPEISLTLPASRGQLTNVEGLVSDIVRDLSLDQPVRKIMDPTTHEKIEVLLDRLRECLDDDNDEATTGEKPEKKFTPFTLKLDDPSGNSYVQFYGTTSDAQWSLRAYNRTREQNVSLGLVAEEEEAATAPSTKEPVGDIDGTRPSMVEREDGTVVPEEVFSFPGACSSCGHQIDTLMQRVNIPHFKVGPCALCRLPRSNADRSTLCRRTLSSCRPTVNTVGTGTTRSSRVEPSRTRGKRSFSRWKTKRTSAETSSR